MSSESVNESRKPNEKRRTCGECTLCCKLLPVEEIDKEGFTKCQHLKFKVRCSIYNERPVSCLMWSCAWLVNPTLQAAGLDRPSKSHYVVDTRADNFRIQVSDEVLNEYALQIWVDPNFPNAHRDPKLRKWLIKHHPRTLIMIRLAPLRALLLVPPARSASGDWFERETPVNPDLSNAPSKLGQFLRNSWELDRQEGLRQLILEEFKGDVMKALMSIHQVIEANAEETSEAEENPR